MLIRIKWCNEVRSCVQIEHFVLYLFFLARNFDPQRDWGEIRKCLHSKKLAEREGFEPSIELLDPITV